METFKTNRRKNADWMIKGATWLSVASWLLTIGAFLTLEIASPTTDNLLTHLFGGTERLVWNDFALLITFALLLISIVSCIVAFIFNMLRMRRKTDKYKKSIIVVFMITMIGLMVFMLRFGSLLF